MRTSLAYAFSVGLHGAVFGALAYAATAYPELMTIQFAVREGDANGAMSQPRWARRIEATFDTQLAQSSPALVVTTPAPVMSPTTPPAQPPLPESSIVLPPPQDLPTVANRDDAPIAPGPITRSAMQRTGRGPEPFSTVNTLELPRETGRVTTATNAPVAVAEARLESPVADVPEMTEVLPERTVATPSGEAQAGLVTRAATVSVQPLEPGNDDFDAIAANSPQGARVSQLPSRLPRNREPAYPEELRRQGIGGTVLLRVTITAEGTAQDVTLAKSSGYPALDESALTAVRAWRFEPARRNNVAVKYTVKLPITFSVRR